MQQIHAWFIFENIIKNNSQLLFPWNWNYWNDFDREYKNIHIYVYIVLQLFIVSLKIRKSKFFSKLGSFLMRIILKDCIPTTHNQFKRAYSRKKIQNSMCNINKILEILQKYFFFGFHEDLNHFFRILRKYLSQIHESYICYAAIGVNFWEVFQWHIKITNKCVDFRYFRFFIVLLKNVAEIYSNCSIACVWYMNLAQNFP